MARWLGIAALFAAPALARDDPGFPYTESDAKAFAALAQASYCGPDQGLLDWSCAPCQRAGFQVVAGSVKFIDHQELGQSNSTFIVIARLDPTSTKDRGGIDGCLVSIRGSTTPTNWIEDFMFWEHRLAAYDGCDTCHVETGFYNIWTTVKPEVIQGLKDIGCSPGGETSSIYITGHSLGAAVSNLAMFDMASSGFQVQQSFNFESPRVGDKNFVQAFHDRFARQIPVFRLTHKRDPVVHLPLELMGYEHVVYEVFYNATGGYKVCDGNEDPTCADQYGLDLLSSGDHCSTTLTPTGDICSCDVPPLVI